MIAPVVAAAPGGGTVPPSSVAYYHDRYWNELDAVNEHVQRRATGEPLTDWIGHLASWHGRPFTKALILNCGNGWVERLMVDRGLVGEAVGIDISADLLAEAERAAAGRPLRYHRVDVNEAAFPEGGYDLVVNHAAAHHISHIDRVFRAIATMLGPDGVFVSWDYVGPHRNQYPGGMWEAAHRVNLALPDHLRSPMHYPSIDDMLRGDPTEAIHSELVLNTTRRYFTVAHERALGGGIAYLLLTHNAAFLDSSPAETAPWLDLILDHDAAYTDAAPEHSLFAYVIAQPDQAALADLAALTRWAAEEREREDRAAADGGRYYPPTAVADAIAHERTRPLAPGEACRRAAVSLTRAVARRTPPAWQERARRLPGVDVAWKRLGRVYRG